MVPDVHSSFTCASIMEDETANTLRSALLANTSILQNSSCVIRIDAATGFQALRNGLQLKQFDIELDFGYIKNKNSNCVVDKAIQELENELLKIDNIHGLVSDVQLQLALSVLNSRIRNRELLAGEILFQRDQVTNEQIHISDQVLAESQISNRTNSHLSSANSKTPGCSLASAMDCKVGDLVFLKDKRNKNKAHDNYVVVSIDGRCAYVKKLTERFMSRKYKVPLTNLYATIVTKENDQLHLVHEDSDSDYLEYQMCGTNDTDNGNRNDDNIPDSNCSSSEESDNADTPIEVIEQVIEQVDRPVRSRRQSAWMRGSAYDLE